MSVQAGIAGLQELPQHLAEALLSGGLSVDGGVLRDTGGQVLGHIAAPLLDTVTTGVPIGPISLVSAVGRNIQLYRLSEDVQRVLTVSMTGTVLAGLGVAVSIGGFIYLSKRMSQLDRRISELARDTKEIKEILLTEFHARFQGAMDDYRTAAASDDTGFQHQLLLRAQRTFGDLAYFYSDRMRDASKLIDKAAAEGYFVLSSIGYAMCSSDLGLAQDAHASLEKHHAHWQSLARKHTTELLKLDAPEKFLHRQYVDSLPIEVLIEILDFGKQEQRGLRWVDELRRALADRTMILAIGKVDDEAIGFAKSLVARDRVLGGYVAHFNFLCKQQMTVTQFANTVSMNLLNSPASE